MNFKLTSSKTLRIFICIVFLLSSVFSTGIVSADVEPAITSAAYNVGTGALVLTGTNFTQTNGALNDFDPTKIMLTDGNLNVTTLTTATKKVERTSDTSATITIGSADAGALAKWMVNTTTGAYTIKVMAGWNGTTSKADFVGKPVTISGMPMVTGASYDYTKGTLTITGTYFVSISGTKNDISPKYLMMSDDVSNMNALTSTAGSEITNNTTASITLAAKDKLALESFINSNGTVTLAGDTYKLYMTSGWNGPTSMGNMQGIPVTVTNWTAPTATMITTYKTGKSAVEYSDAVKTGISGKSNKAGTMYLVNSDSFTNGTSTQTDLESLVAAKTALKTTITTANIGKSITLKAAGLTMTNSTGAYCFVAVDAAGGCSIKSSTILINNIEAPAISPGTVVAGSLDNTVVFSATPATGDTFKYRKFQTVSSTGSAVAPKLLTSLSTISYSNQLLDYDASTGISGILKTNYLEVFEINGSSQVIKYKLMSGAASKEDKTAPTVDSTSISSDKKTLTVKFSENIVSSFAFATVVLTNHTKYSLDDGATWSNFNAGTLSGDTSASTISGANVNFVFTTAYSSPRIIIKMDANEIADTSGNGADAFSATFSDKAGFNVGTPSPTGAVDNSGKAIYTVSVTSAKDRNGSPLTGVWNFTSSSSKGSAIVSTTSSSANFTVGEATIPVLVSTSGAQNVVVNITGVATSSSDVITVADQSDYVIGTVVSTGGAAEGYVNFDIPITGAKDGYGVLMTKTGVGYTITSTQAGQGITVSANSATANFVGGAAILHASINRSGAQTLLISITGITNVQSTAISVNNNAGFTVGVPTSSQQLNGVGYLRNGSISYSIPITTAKDELGNLLNGSYSYNTVTTSAAADVIGSGTIIFSFGSGTISNVSPSTTGANNVWIHITGIASTKSAATITIAAENKALTASLPAGSIISGTGSAFTYNLTVNANDFSGIGYSGTKNLRVEDSGSGVICTTAVFGSGSATIPISFSTPGSHTITITSSDNNGSCTVTKIVAADASSSGTWTVSATGNSSGVTIAGGTTQGIGDDITINLTGVHYADGTTVAATTVNVNVKTRATGVTVTYPTVFNLSGNGSITFAAATSSAYDISFANDGPNDTSHLVTAVKTTNSVTVTAYSTAFTISTAAAAIVEFINVTGARDSLGALLQGLHHVKVTTTSETCFDEDVIFLNGASTASSPIKAVISTLASATGAGNLRVVITDAVGGQQTVTSGTTVTAP